MLCLSGIVLPSLISAPYFLSFLSISTYWALNNRVTDQFWRLFLKVAAIYTAAHLILLYLYQMIYAQQLVKPHSLAAR